MDESPMASSRKGTENTVICILLANGQIDDALRLAQSDSSRRKELEHTRLEEDYEIRIRGLWLLHELGEALTIEELLPLFNSNDDEAIIGAALLMSEVNGTTALNKLIDGIPRIVTHLLKEDHKRAEEIAEIEGWDEHFPEPRDPMTVLWAIVLAMSSQGQKAIEPIRMRMMYLIKKNGLDEYELIHTISTLRLALHLISKQGIDAYNEIKHQVTKETFYYYDECFGYFNSNDPFDPKDYINQLEQMLTQNPLYTRWAQKALETIKRQQKDE